MLWEKEDTVQRERERRERETPLRHDKASAADIEAAFDSAPSLKRDSGEPKAAGRDQGDSRFNARKMPLGGAKMAFLSHVARHAARVATAHGTARELTRTPPSADPALRIGDADKTKLGPAQTPGHHPPNSPTGTPFWGHT